MECFFNFRVDCRLEVEEKGRTGDRKWSAVKDGGRMGND